MPFLTSFHVATSSACHRALLVLLALCMCLTVSSGQEVISVHLTDRSQERPTSNPSTSAEEGIVGLMDPVMRLNRFTFEQTILEEHADPVPHWIVLFCPPWYEPCQALEPIYKNLTQKWQDQLNNAVLSSEVRFAAVDCATEKALCNTQNVDTYPFVAHYRNRKQVKVWRGKNFDSDATRLRDFLRKELGPIAAATSMQVDMDDVTPESGLPTVPVDFLLIFAVIAGNAWFISHGGFGGEATSCSALCEKPLQGAASTPLASPQQEQHASSVVRSLPKEWSRDRPCYDL